MKKNKETIRKPCCVPTCKDRISTRHSIPRTPISLHLEWLRRIKNDRMKHLTPQQIWKRHRVCDQHFTDANKIQDLSHLREFSVPSLLLPGFDDEVLSDFFSKQVVEDHRSSLMCCVPNCQDKESYRHCIPKDPPGYHLEFIRRVQNEEMKGLTQNRICAQYSICDRHFSNNNKLPGMRGLQTFSLPTLFLPDGLQGEVLSEIYQANLEEMNAWRKVCCVPNCVGHVIKYNIPHSPLAYHQEWVRRINNDLMNNMSAMEIINTFYVCDRHFSSEVKIDDLNCLRPFALPSLNLMDDSREELNNFFLLEVKPSRPPKKVCCVPKCIGHAIKHCIPYEPLIYHQEWVRRIKNDLMNGLSSIEICELFYVCDRHFSDAVKMEDLTCLKPFSLPSLNLLNSSEDQLSDFFPEELLFKAGNDYQCIKNELKSDTKVIKAETTNSDDDDEDDDDCIQYWIVITA